MTLKDFDVLPILDYNLHTTDKPAFLDQLRNALIRVGFLYLVNHTVEPDAIDAIATKHIPAFFGLPQDEKDKLLMSNSPHFLGYTRLGNELTKDAIDHREQFDFGTPLECNWTESANVPEYYRLGGPSQYPEEHIIPGFQDALNRYLKQVTALSYEFSTLVAEALGLPPDALAQFYENPSIVHHRAKIVRYPVIPGKTQGVGPHFDAGFLTFLVQASPHKGLQAQNLAGEWIDVPPIPGSFVVNFGKALEFVTRGVIRATPHRVLSPTGDTPRYSIPFFQNINLDVRLTDRILDLPQHVLDMRDQRGATAAMAPINFSEYDREPNGKVTLIAQVKSHPHVAARYYPDVFKLYFPDGHIPYVVSAY